MYLERAMIKKMEKVLLAGSFVTLLAGLGLLFFPTWLLSLADIPAEPMFFIQLTGLMLMILGAAYCLTLMEHEKNHTLLALGFFQKLGVTVLMVSAVFMERLPVVILTVAIFDGLMAILFLLHLKGARSDGWA